MLHVVYLHACNNSIIVIIYVIDLVELRELHPQVCKWEKFSFYVAIDCSIWLLTTFTFDRCIAVCFPLVRVRYYKHRHIYTAVTAVTIVSILFNIHVFWTRGAEYCEAEDGSRNLYTNCGYPDAAAEKFEYHIKPWLTLSLANIAPFILILLFNIAIIRSIFKSPVRKSSTASKYGATNGLTTNGKTKKTSYSQSTFMCIAASATFLFCITPGIVLFVGRPRWEEGNGYEAAKAISDQLTNVNHSANLFLYCLTGQRFRKQLLTIFKCNTRLKKRIGYVFRLRTTPNDNSQGENSLVVMSANPRKKDSKYDIRTKGVCTVSTHDGSSISGSSFDDVYDNSYL